MKARSTAILFLKSVPAFGPARSTFALFADYFRKRILS
jgi:hypothetical protein